MKTLIQKSILMAVLFTFSLSMLAQGPGNRERRTPEERAKNQTEMMVKELKLDKDQEKKVSEINLKYAKMMDDTREKAGGDRDKIRENMRTQMEEKNKELKKILTDDQYKIWQTKQEEMRNNRQRNNNRP